MQPAGLLLSSLSNIKTHTTTTTQAKENDKICYRVTSYFNTCYAKVFTLYWIYAAGPSVVRPGGTLAMAARQRGASAVARSGGAVAAAQWRGAAALARPCDCLARQALATAAHVGSGAARRYCDSSATARRDGAGPGALAVWPGGAM